MAINEISKFGSKQSLSPGGRGEVTHPSFPGIRHQETDDRLTRSNNKFPIGLHDNIAGKYELDDRLPALFRYGFAMGYNHMVIPKGRLVAADPYLSIVDPQVEFANPALTIANGGEDVDLDVDQNFKAATAPFVLDLKTGRDTTVPTRRPANLPMGIMGRNEYTRYEGAFNGMQPAPVLTDCWYEVPLFANEEKAKAALWTGAYNLTEVVTADELKNGDKLFRVGILVKSDKNGRMIPSPLNNMDNMIAGSAPTKAELIKIQEEQAQIVGKVVSMTSELGSTSGNEFVQWNTEDISNFDEFNPDVKAQSYRGRGEDIVSQSPYGHFEKSGLLQQTLYSNDLQMIEGNDNYNKRHDLKNRMDFGIPGLSDGTNAVKGSLGADLAATFAGTATDTVNLYVEEDEIEMSGYTDGLTDYFIRLNDSNIKKLAVAFSGNATSVAPPEDLTSVAIGHTFGAGTYGTTAVNDFLVVKYIDLMQGIVRFDVSDIDEYNKALAECTNGVLKMSYATAKDGQAGIPVYVDFEGVIGKVRVLLTC